mgnify:CR=1 FL=1
MKKFVDPKDINTLNLNLKDFNEVYQFIQIINEIIMNHDHHPDVTFNYNTINIKSTTHDANNSVTEKDIKLIEEINESYKKFSGKTSDNEI